MCADAGNRLRMVSVSQVGNLDGVETPIREITKIAKDFDALVCVDGAQSAPHMPVDVQAMGIDFFAFSIHKMLGPQEWEDCGGEKIFSTACEPSNRAVKL